MVTEEQALADEVERACVAIFAPFAAYRAEHGWYFEDDSGALQPASSCYSGGCSGSRLA
jgi:hypothetical protein